MSNRYTNVDNDRGFLSPVHEWRSPLMVPHVNILPLGKEALHPPQVTTPDHRTGVRSVEVHTVDTMSACLCVNLLSG